MNKAIELIKYLIKEHEKAGFCTERSEADELMGQDVIATFDKLYQLGRYETLVDLLNNLERIGE